MSGKNVAVVITVDDAGTVSTPVLVDPVVRLRIPVYLAQRDREDPVRTIRRWFNHHYKKGGSGRHSRIPGADSGAFGALGSKPCFLAGAKFGGDQGKSGEAWHLHVSRDAYDRYVGPILSGCRLMSLADVEKKSTFACEHERFVVRGALRNAQSLPVAIPA